MYSDTLRASDQAVGHFHAHEPREAPPDPRAFSRIRRLEHIPARATHLPRERKRDRRGHVVHTALFEIDGRALLRSKKIKKIQKFMKWEPTANWAP